jgi:hypothetical protein
LEAVPVAGSVPTVTVKLEGVLQTALRVTLLTPVLFTITPAVPAEVMGVARYVPGALKEAMVAALPCVTVMFEVPLISVKVMTSPAAKVLIVVEPEGIEKPAGGKSVGTVEQPTDFALAVEAVSTKAINTSSMRNAPLRAMDEGEVIDRRGSKDMEKGYSCGSALPVTGS